SMPLVSNDEMPRIAASASRRAGRGSLNSLRSASPSSWTANSIWSSVLRAIDVYGTLKPSADFMCIYLAIVSLGSTPIAALADRRLLLLVRGWAPFVMVLVAYEVMRDAASALGMPAHDLARFDRTLFAGYQPTLVLQAAIGRLADADVFDDLGSVVYATHFLLPVAVGIWLWKKDHDAFRRLGLTLVVLCGLAFITYVIAPTTPPWLAQP